MNRNYFKNRLKFARLRMGLTQRELATKIGISTNAIFYYETGHRFPKVEFLYKLAQALSVTADYLLEENDTPENTIIAEKPNLNPGKELKQRIEYVKKIGEEFFQNYSESITNDYELIVKNKSLILQAIIFTCGKTRKNSVEMIRSFQKMINYSQEYLLLQKKL